MIAVVAAVAVTRGGDADPPVGAVDVAGCRGLLAEAARECQERVYLAAVEGRRDPRPAVAAITAAARREGGDVLGACHGVMHTVGRTYAREADVTPARLREYLPRSNDPGCSAGFAHGLVTGIVPELDPRRPREAAAACVEGTRYQRYSCVHGLGHAFMRIAGERLPQALEFCRALGPRAAADCAQGAYHDHWFAALGADGTSLPRGAETDPRRLCAAQPVAFVRPCWYRAFVENRPEGLVVDSPEHLDVLCEELSGLQREACITGAAVIGPSDPSLQLALCAGLDVAADAAACVRGTKVQNLLGSSTGAFVGLFAGCERFGRAVRAGCYRWLGKTVAVLTDGAFERDGCRRLPEPDARALCRTGARAMEEALVTFS